MQHNVSNSLNVLQEYLKEKRICKMSDGFGFPYLNKLVEEKGREMQRTNFLFLYKLNPPKVGNF